MAMMASKGVVNAAELDADVTVGTGAVRSVRETEDRRSVAETVELADDWTCEAA